jgi:hypothetical protein
VTIPAQLARELERLRDDVNLSLVCTRALEREVKVRSAVAGKVRSFQKTIERLRAEARNVRQDAALTGFEHGAEWVRERARLAEIEWFAALPVDEPELARRVEREFRRHSKGLDPMLEWLAANPTLDRNEYLRGFAEAVKDVWGRIKDEVAS